jgi:hypothetical protein
VPVMSNEVKNYFYRNCGEDACKMQRHGGGTNGNGRLVLMVSEEEEEP